MQEQIRKLTAGSQQGKLPSSTENNPKTLHAVTLRSGLILPEREKEAVVEQPRKVDPKKNGSSPYDLSIDQFLGSTRPHHLPTGYLAQQYKTKADTARASKAASDDSFRASTSTQSARAGQKEKEKSTPEV